MRICLYTEEPYPRLGGKAAVIDALARQYQAQGHEVVVLATHLRHRAAAPNLPYPLVRHPRFYSLRWFVDWYRWWLSRAQRKFQFDVLHCHSIHPTGYVAACCKAVADIPLIVTSHGDVQSRRFGKQRGLAERCRFVLERADAAVALSQFMEARFAELAPQARRIERIPNGVEVAQFSRTVARPAELDAAIRPGEYFLFVGRLIARKGADLLLEALARLDRGPGLVIAGQGDAAAELRAQAERLGLAGRVWFVGPVAGDLKTYLYQHALATVVPSRISEAFGLVPLESYAAGRPVIASEIPGLCELVVLDETGLLVPPDSPIALADAMAALAADPARADRLGQAARRQADKYDWEPIAQRHLALYAEVAGGLRRAA